MKPAAVAVRSAVPAAINGRRAHRWAAPTITAPPGGFLPHSRRSTRHAAAGERPAAGGNGFDSSFESGLDAARDAASALKDSALSKGDVAGEARLLGLCAATARGQVASAGETASIAALLRTLEGSGLGYGSPAESSAMEGDWSLVYCSESPTRSSPFFWAFRELCRGVEQPLPGLSSSLSEALFQITDGIPFAAVGRATHTITGAGGKDGAAPARLTSSVQLTLRVMDAFVPPSEGYVTSVAEMLAVGPTEHEVTLVSTSVKQSSWRALPFLSGMGDIEFPGREVFNRLRDGAATVRASTTYLSDQLRITRVGELTLVHLRQ